MISALVVLLMNLPPKPAAYLAAVLHGRPGIAKALIRVCRRESRCQTLGIHAIDSHLDGWGGQVRLGHLRAWCQPWAPMTWTTRGAWGLSAASHWRYLPACYPAAALDIPIVSAMVAAAKHLERCDVAKTSSWCPTRPVRRF